MARYDCLLCRNADFPQLKLFQALLGETQGKIELQS